MTDEQKVREAFEAWVRSGNADEVARIHDAWIGWQAAWQAAISHASATAEECLVIGEAVSWQYRSDTPRSGWTEWCEIPTDVAESYRKEWGGLRGSFRGLAAEIRHLYTHPPRAAEDTRDAEAKLAAFRNRFISERTTTWLRDGLNYEMARAKAEADANEYEQAFDQAIAGKRGEK